MALALRSSVPISDPDTVRRLEFARELFFSGYHLGEIAVFMDSASSFVDFAVF
jgi:hypothetical protein